MQRQTSRNVPKSSKHDTTTFQNPPPERPRGPHRTRPPNRPPNPKKKLADTPFRAQGRPCGHLCFDAFQAPSQRGFFELWEARRPPKWKPFRILFETFAENLKTSVFNDPSMVLAGPDSQNGSLFGCFFGAFSELDFLIVLGTHFGHFGVPPGIQWETILSQNRHFWGVRFSGHFLDRSGSVFGRGRRQGRSLSKHADPARTC